MLSNLQRERKKWAQMTRVFIREGAYAWISGRIYLTVVQSDMLYGLETCVMTPGIQKVLGKFHHRVTRRLTGRQPWRRRYGIWV